MAKVIAALMRHGIYEQPVGTPSAHLPYALKPEAEAQIRASTAKLAVLCQEKGWTLEASIDCSVLLRAWQTAGFAADEASRSLGREFYCESFEALMERSVGSAANLNLEQIASAVDADPRLDALPSDWKQQADFKLPMVGAESLTEAGARVRDHVVARCAALADSGHDTLKLFVGHGGSFRHAAVRMGVLDVEEARRLSLHYGGFVLLEQCESDAWKMVGGTWKQRTAADIEMRQESA